MLGQELGLADPGVSLGTSFTRLLDARRTASDAAIEASSRELTESRLLLVDDRPELLNSLYELVRAHGYVHVEKALGGQAALDALANGEFELVLLDLIMPDVSGHDVLQFARDRGIKSKIVVVSGDASFSGVKHALTCGAFDFVKKPYEASELVATMQNALQARDLELRNSSMSRQLKESEMLYRFIVNSSPDLVYICLLYTSDAADE